MDARKKLALFSILVVGITVPYFPFVWQVGNYEHAISIYNVIFCAIGIITYFFVKLTLNYKIRKAYLVGLVIFLMMAYMSLAYLGGLGQDFLLSSKTVLSSVFLITLYSLYLAYLVLIRPDFPLYGKKPGWFVSVYLLIFVIFSMIHFFQLVLLSWQFPGVVTNLVSYIIQVAIAYEALRIVASKPADFVKKMVASVIFGMMISILLAEVFSVLMELGNPVFTMANYDQSMIFLSLSLLLFGISFMLLVLSEQFQLKLEIYSMLPGTSQEHILQMLEFEKEGIVSIDPKTYKITSANKAAEEIVGLSPLDGIGPKLSNTLDLSEFFRETINSGYSEKQIISTNKIVQIKSAYIQTRDGPKLFLHARDITEEATKTLKDKQKANILKSLVQTSELIDKATTIGGMFEVSWNAINEVLPIDAFSLLLLNSDDSIEKGIFFKGLDNNEREIVKIVFKRYSKIHKKIQSQDVFPKIIDLPFKSQVVFQMEISARVKGYMFVASKVGSAFNTDVADMMKNLSNQLALAIQKNLIGDELKDKVAMLEEMNKGKDEFIASMTHELRTPLTTLLGFLELLDQRKPNMTKEQIEFISIASQSAESLSWLIEDLIDLGRLKNGKFTFHNNRNFFSDMFYQETGKLTKSAWQKGITVENMFVGENKLLLLDKEVVSRIIGNLCKASLMYLHKGDKMRFYCKVTDGNLVLSVIDDGKQWTKEDLAYISDAFARIPSKTLEEHPGSVGLALSYAKEFTKAMGGTFEVRTLPFGNYIKITIPEKPNRELE
ncbi:MAG: histidine kinase dimerization/phospho-acceptor domain-containing protein [Caldisericales bacterium]|nr:PAS domain-containing sensor histidine kinase [bacterium]